jgi:hydroxypyruvate isomerase
MTEFSANLGFLWADLPLPRAIEAAARVGFDAVECHWPYATPAEEVKAALSRAGLPLLSLNTARGAAHEFGLSALPGREDEACAAIDQALGYAGATGARMVHVMAGMASGPRAHAAFAGSLGYACEKARPLGIVILIEPLNPRDAPGYFLHDIDQALALIRALDQPNLKLMFDCYHVQIMEGDLRGALTRCLPHIGHIQFASVPDRGPPGRGEIDYAQVFAHLRNLGYDAPLGAEYIPPGKTEMSLGWMDQLKRS